jgi:hypothetical protein
MILSLSLLAGCGSDPVSSNPPTPKPPVQQRPLPGMTPGLALPDNRTSPRFEVLLFGNSHLQSHDLPGMLQLMLQQGRPQAISRVQRADDWAFLDERLADGRSWPLLQSQPWTHLVLQGQKYSTTGLYSYPIDASLSWIALAKQLQITPVLFPEHARAGNKEEGERVYLLHQRIARQDAACVVPIPLGWYQLMQQTGLGLHEPDGNHANKTGAAFTAFMLYQVLSGDPADQLPTIPALALSASVQQQLRQWASATLQQYPACPFAG